MSRQEALLEPRVELSPPHAIPQVAAMKTQLGQAEITTKVIEDPLVEISIRVRGKEMLLYSKRI